MTRPRPIPDASLGQPTPADTDAIFRSLMEEDFSTALSSVWSRLQDRGVALQDVLTELHPRSGIRIHVPQPALERTRIQPYSVVFRCVHCIRLPRIHTVL